MIPYSNMYIVYFRNKSCLTHMVIYSNPRYVQMQRGRWWRNLPLPLFSYVTPTTHVTSHKTYAIQKFSAMEKYSKTPCIKLSISQEMYYTLFVLSCVLFCTVLAGAEYSHLRYICNPNDGIVNLQHYNDVIMRAMASQITSPTIAYSTVNSRHRSRKT